MFFFVAFHFSFIVLISLASCIFAIPQSRNCQQEWSRVGCELTLERALHLSPDMYKANSFGRIRLERWMEHHEVQSAGPVEPGDNIRLSTITSRTNPHVVCNKSTLIERR